MKLFKKSFLFLLAFICLFGLVACSKNNETEEPEPEPQPTPQEEVYGLQKSKEDVQTSLLAMAAVGTGIEIEVQTYIDNEVTGSKDLTTQTLGYKDNTVWMYSTAEESSSKAAIEFVDNKYILMYMEYSGSWNYLMAYEILEGTTAADYGFDLEEVFNSFLECYDLSDNLLLEGEATIAGRACNVYKYDVLKEFKGTEQYSTKLAETEFFTYYYIDKVLGVCLKQEVKYTDESKEASVELEVKTINFSPTAPTLPRPEKIRTINGKNPLDLFESFGLNGLIPTGIEVLDDDNYQPFELDMLMSYVYNFNLIDVTEADFQTTYQTLGDAAVTLIKTVSDDGKAYCIMDGEATKTEITTAYVQEDGVYIYFTLNETELYACYSLEIDSNYTGAILTISIGPYISFE